MKGIVKILIVGVAIIGLTSWVMAGTITLDGDFSDWSSADQVDVSPSIFQPVDEEDAGDAFGDYDIDIEDIWVTHDSQYLSVSVSVVTTGTIDFDIVTTPSRFYEIFIDTKINIISDHDIGYASSWAAPADFMVANYNSATFLPDNLWKIQPWTATTPDWWSWSWGSQTDVSYAIGNWNGTHNRIETSIPLSALGISDPNNFGANVFVIFKTSAGWPLDFAPDNLNIPARFRHLEGSWTSGVAEWNNY